ncbi:MAG: glycosyltransferase [Muribaculum sp.]|nr:glycosyltransferase [Muribaculum sp.]
MNVLIISLFGLGSSGRAFKIATHTFRDDNVCTITSDFSHQAKTYYKSNVDSEMHVDRLHVRPYYKNLSVKRITSHLSFAWELKKYLRQIEELPDLVYCCMPSSSAAYVTGKFCKKHKIPFIIDVIDLWPDSLIPIMPFRKLVKSILYPWQRMTHRAYKLADYISAESKKYAEVAHDVNGRVPYSYTYLGVDQDKINCLICESSVALEKPDNEIWIGYGGSLGQSYDFDVILEGLKYLKEKKVKYKMWFIGDGEKATYIHNIANQNNLNIAITGRLEYKDLLKYLSYCDIAVNSFREGTLVVHSYKFNDYVATGCYVLNNLPGETAQMIDNYKIGYNYNPATFRDVLYETIANWPKLKQDLPRNLLRLINKEFDTAIIYKRLKHDIEEKLLR